MKLFVILYDDDSGNGRDVDWIVSPSYNDVEALFLKRYREANGLADDEDAGLEIVGTYEVDEVDGYRVILDPISIRLKLKEEGK